MAAITGYASLKTALADYLARSDLTAYVDYFIQQWEEDFYREPKNFGRWMETGGDSPMVSGQVAVPASLMALKYAYIVGNPGSRLDRVSINQLYGRFPRGGDTGIPQWVSREAGQFVFGPFPDAVYTVHFVWWNKPTAIRSFASDAAAHWIILNAPDIALLGSLMMAEPFLKNDSRLMLWQSLLDRAVVSYRRLMRDEDLSGSPSQEVLG